MFYSQHQELLTTEHVLPAIPSSTAVLSMLLALTEFNRLNCGLCSEPGVIRDQLSNSVNTSSCVTSVTSASLDMKTSYTDSEKSPTELSYELPSDSTAALPTVSKVFLLESYNVDHIPVDHYCI